MQMNLTFWCGSKEPESKIKCRILGNPLGAALSVLAIMYLAGFAWCVIKYLRDNYLPYNGEVIAITRSWTDWLVFEHDDQEHLVIRTPDGDTIDRIVSMQTRSLQRIEVGDYVVKDRGMSRKVRPRDKMTVQEIRDMSRKRLTTKTPNKTPAGDVLKAAPEE
jgi:hypothetical protein